MRPRCYASTALTARTSSKTSAKLIRTSESSRSLMNGLTICRKCQLIASEMCSTTLSSSREMLSSSQISTTNSRCRGRKEARLSLPLSRMAQIKALSTVMLSNQLARSIMTRRVMGLLKCLETRDRQALQGKIHLLS